MASAVQVETASDGTRLYTYEQALEVFKTLKAKKFTSVDLVLVILGAQDKPVHGKALLMEELLLLHKEVLKDASTDPRFAEDRRGPYSFHMENVLDVLCADGVLGRRRRWNFAESFQLTAKGAKTAEKVLKKLSKSDRRLVSSKRKAWDQLGAKRVRDYIHAKHPEYKTPQ